MSRKVSLDQIGYVLDQDRFYLLEEGSGNDLQLEQLKKALSQVIRSRLTARQRETLYLYYYEKKKIIEIAALQKVNKSTVSRTLARARANIKRYLEFYSLR